MLSGVPSKNRLEIKVVRPGRLNAKKLDWLGGPLYLHSANVGVERTNALMNVSEPARKVFLIEVFSLLKPNRSKRVHLGSLFSNTFVPN
jgi:hypothetical protein